MSGLSTYTVSLGGYAFQLSVFFSFFGKLAAVVAHRRQAFVIFQRSEGFYISRNTVIHLHLLFSGYGLLLGLFISTFLFCVRDQVVKFMGGGFCAGSYRVVRVISCIFRVYGCTKQLLWFEQVSSSSIIIRAVRLA